MAYLEYHENTSKNNPGGLKHRKVNSKVVTHYQNTANPSRCFVRLYKLYLSKCPDNVNMFFLKPLSKPKENQWYTRQSVGHNILATSVKTLCEKANLSGKRTNHSLRASAATRLFHGNVSEQMIMEVTGHRSTDGVRCYKQVARDQFKEVSAVLQSSKIPAAEPEALDHNNKSVPSKEKVVSKEVPPPVSSSENIPPPVPSHDKVPSPVPSRDNVPSPVLSRDNVPSPVPSCDNVPSPVPSRDNVPQQIVLHDCSNINFNF